MISANGVCETALFVTMVGMLLAFVLGALIVAWVAHAARSGISPIPKLRRAQPMLEGAETKSNDPLHDLKLPRIRA